MRRIIRKLVVHVAPKQVHVRSLLLRATAGAAAVGVHICGWARARVDVDVVDDV